MIRKLTMEAAFASVSPDVRWKRKTLIHTLSGWGSCLSPTCGRCVAGLSGGECCPERAKARRPAGEWPWAGPSPPWSPSGSPSAAASARPRPLTPGAPAPLPTPIRPAQRLPRPWRPPTALPAAP